MQTHNTIPTNLAKSVCKQCGATFVKKRQSSGSFCGQLCCSAYRRANVTPQADRFWNKVDKSGNCWRWLAAHTADGYGTFRVKRVTNLAHRLSWEMHFGVIPDGMFVCHRCDNPGCVNPEHLFLGADSDNKRDMVSKKRHAFGERVAGSKLTEAQALEIIQLATTGASHTDIAAMYRIDKSHVSGILTGRSWKHLSAK